MSNKSIIPQEVEEIRKQLEEGKELSIEQLELLFLDTFLEEEGHERR